METRAITKFIRVSPRKVRLVVDQIRGKGVEEALNILKFIPKRSAGIVAKTVRTAVANAENTQSVDVDRLFVSEAFGGATDASALSSYRLGTAGLGVLSPSVKTTETAASTMCFSAAARVWSDCA